MYSHLSISPYYASKFDFSLYRESFSHIESQNCALVYFISSINYCFLLKAKSVVGILFYLMMMSEKNFSVSESQCSQEMRTKLAGTMLLEVCISFLYMSGQNQVLREMKRFLLQP